MPARRHVSTLQPLSIVMKITLHKTCLVIAGLGLAAISLPAQTLLLRYDFSTFVDGVVKDGSGNNHDGQITGLGTWGADQTGVTGLAGDRAFNNTASIMGSTSANTGGAVVAPALGNMTSFTISLWFKTDGAQFLTGSARLFDMGTLLLAGVGSGKVSLNAGATVLAANGTADTSIAAQNSWVFIAVTYDGTSATGLNNIKIYAGSATGAVTLVATNTSSSLTGAQSLAATYFGANAVLGRAFDGWLDDIRVYGDASGAAGALSETELNAVRLAGATGIPEPSSAAVIAGGAGLAAVAALRRRKGAAQDNR